MSLVILGAGLTGLSTAYHFVGPYRIFEKEERPGGLCRSFDANGFTFDITGHLLHFQDPRVGDFLENMLPHSLLRVERKAVIFSNGVYTKYPFQVNTYGLPPHVVEECLLGFLEAKKKIVQGSSGSSFLEWIQWTFGSGFAKHFFVPYNEKLFRTDLAGITSDWVSWSIPRPKIREVVEGALGIVREGFGYNTWFLYPRQGGIEALIRALASRLEPVETGKKAIAVRTRQKVVEFDDGEEVAYEQLVSTIPLPELLKISDLEPDVKEAGEKLRYVSVLDVNLGIEGNQSPEFHWSYFPEKEYPFYRVGIASNFCEALAPPGSKAFYVEISLDPEKGFEESEAVKRVLSSMEMCGVIGGRHHLSAIHTFLIRHAYVIYDKHREKTLGPILSRLESLGIHSIGRYGAWEYATMEKSILWGMTKGFELRKVIS